MRLSLCIMTVNSAAYIEDLLRAGRSFADEIVVAIDGFSTDSTEEICGRYADKLFLTEPLGDFSKALIWLNEQCSGDWILWLDQDELLGTRLVETLPRLMDDREITHYWLRRRWIVGEERDRWISQYPWWPDWQLRLYRNIPSIMRYPGRIHTSFDIRGAARYVYEGSFYHLDLVYHSRQQRQQKVELYERLSPGNKLEHFYLPDEASLATDPIPADDAPLVSDSRPGTHVGLRGLLAPGGRARRTAQTPARKVSLAEIRRLSAQDVEYPPEQFRASLDCSACPKVMFAGRWHAVDVELRNDSDIAWPPLEQGIQTVRIGYHWLRSDGEMHQYNGHRTNLPHTLRPGETTRLPTSVLAPEEPGSYILQWDLVIENVSWFSTQGWRGPSVGVHVSNESPESTGDGPATA